MGQDRGKTNSDKDHVMEKGLNDAPLKGAVIGYGFIASRGHLPAYLKRSKERGDVEIQAVADICPARCQAAASDLPGVKIYSSASELLEAQGQDLDFVDIATPPCDHAAIAHLALDRGLHVLCEKPLTVTLEEAKGLLEHATRAKRVLFPCHNYKHAPVVKAIRKLIDEDRIGRVRSVTLNTFRNTHAKGVPEWNTHWRREKRISGGGIAMDHGSHTFYLTFDWLGSYPTAVSSRAQKLNDQYDTEDNVSAVLKFPTGLAHVHLSWTAGVRKVIYTIQGEKGAITAIDDTVELATMHKTSGPDVAQGAVSWTTETIDAASDWMDASHVQWFDSLFDQFRGAILRGEPVSQETLEAYRCVALIEGVYRSEKEGGCEMPLFSPPS